MTINVRVTSNSQPIKALVTSNKQSIKASVVSDATLMGKKSRRSFGC